MQLLSDPLLGWTTIANRCYVVRQLNDHKASIDVEALKGPGLAAYAEVCGELLARGHSRSGDVQMIAGYIGNGEILAEALLNFAMAYADQTEADWELLRKSKHARHGAAVGKAAGGEVRELRRFSCGRAIRGSSCDGGAEANGGAISGRRLPGQSRAGTGCCFRDECAGAGPARIP